MVSRKYQTAKLILMLLVMIVIFVFSNQSVKVSHEISDAVAKSVNIPTTYDWQDASGIPLALGLTFRKYAHVCQFFVLGIATYVCFPKWWITLPVCYGYAVFDEIHQFFVPGRGASFFDTVLDLIGVICAVFVCVLFKKIYGLVKIERKQ